MKSLYTLIISILIIQISYSQQDNVDLKAVNGNGFRFWNGSDNYKIHMGNTNEYKYGPVQDFSIKTNMVGLLSRGWTWGQPNRTPIAGLSLSGNFQIAGNFTTKKLSFLGGTTIERLSTTDLRITSNHGFVDIGPKNKDWLHIYTDRPKIIFNKDVYTTTNAFSSFSDDLVFKTKGSERMRIDHQTGYVGIGVLNPKHKLDVNTGGGNFKTYKYGSEFTVNTASSWARGFRLRNENTSKGNQSVVFGAHDGNAYISTGIGTTHEVGFQAKKLTVLSNGNVGIGIITPQNKLSVNGHIWATEIKVSLKDAADWVFEENYNLKPLSEVETYIKENKHLPEIPSAEEFRKNDLKVSEMTNKLLQKIEELTLYAIEQEKELEKVVVLEKENKDLKDQVQSLEARFSKLEALLTK